MAYGLLGNPTGTKNDRVTFADITLVGPFTINLSTELINDTPDGFLFSGGTGSTGFELYRRSSGGGNGWQMFIAGANVTSNANGATWPYYDGVTPNPRTIQITRNAANLITVKNPAGGTELTHTHAGDLRINTLFARGTSFYRGMLFHSLEIINGGFYRKFDANLYDAANPTTLKTTDGQGQGTLFNFPVDGTQWVSYQGGTEPAVEQQHTSGGAVSVAKAIGTTNQFSNEQSRSAFASATRFNVATADSISINAQQIATAGYASRSHSTALQSAAVNSQALSASGIAAVNRGVNATNTYINQQTNLQNYSTGGTVNRHKAAFAKVVAVHVQLHSTAAQADLSKSVAATTVAINSFNNDQLHKSGGETNKRYTLQAMSLLLHEQQQLSSGVAAAIRRAYAATTFYDDGYTPQFTSKGLSAHIIQPQISAQVVKPGYSANII